MGPARRNPVLALAVSAFVVTACGQIAGLKDPDEVNALAAGGGPTGDADAPADDVEISPDSLDLGAAACGDASGAKEIVIKNRGGTTPRYEVKIPDGSPFELTGPAQGDLGKDSEVKLGVIAKPDAPGEETAEIVVKAGNVSKIVTVKITGDGGRVELAPTTANVGAVRRENGGSLDVALTNTGNKTVSLKGITSSLADFSATWAGQPTPLAIDAGATKSIKVALASGVDGDKLSAMMTLALDGTHCGAVPVLPVEGQRVNQDVTITTAEFGNQSCNSTPALTRDIVVSNYTPSTLAYTAKLLSATTAFTIVSGGSGNIAAGSTGTPTTAAVKLSMKKLGATVGPISEDVEVEISGVGPPSGGKRTVKATASVRGAIITITPNNSTGFRRYTQRNFTIANSGNEPYADSHYFIRDANTTQRGAWYFSGPSNVGAGGQGTINIEFDPGYGNYGNYAGTYFFQKSPSSSVPLCNAPTLHLQGSY